jgi:hypothetical protein
LNTFPPKDSYEFGDTPDTYIAQLEMTIKLGALWVFSCLFSII